MQNINAPSSSPKGTWARQNLDGYRAAHAIVDVLVAAGVTEIYGQSCPTALFLAAEKAGIRQIGYRTENAGIAMADGAARQSRKISVITALNQSTNVTSAFKGSYHLKAYGRWARVH